MRIQTLLVLAWVAALAAPFTEAQESNLVARAQKRAEAVKSLTEQLTVRSREDVERYTPQLRDQLTEKVREILVAQVLDTLAERDTDMALLRQQLNGFLAAPVWHEYSGAPYAIRAMVGGTPVVFTAFVLRRGGQGAPETKIFLHAFRKAGAGWEFVAETGGDLDGYELFVEPLKSVRAEEFWLLAYGLKTGSNNKTTRLRVYAFDGQTFRTVWTPPDLLEAEVRVRGESFSVHHLDRRQYYELRESPAYRLDEYVLTYFGVEQISSLLVPE